MARGLKKKIQSVASTFGEAEVVPLNPVDNSPQTVGELLRTKREEHEIDLRETADFLRIRYVYLLAIEEGRVDDLPGATYAMGFVRAYADHLGLDGPAIVERYKDETAELGDDVRLVFPSPLPEGKVPSGTILLVSVIALALVYGGWALFAQRDVKIAELVPALPDSFRSFLGSDESSPPEVTAVPARESSREPATTEPSASVAPHVSSLEETLQPAPSENVPVREEIAASSATPANTEEEAGRNPPTEPTTIVEPVLKEAAKKVVAAVDSSVAANAPITGIAADQSAVTGDAVQAVQASAIPVQSEAGSETMPVQPDTSLPSPEIRAEVTNVDSAAEKTEPLTQDAATENTGVEKVPPVAILAQSAIEPVENTQINETVQASESASETAVSQEVAALPPKPPASGSTEPRQFGAENTVSRVLIKARIDSWVEIRDAAGELMLTRVLRTGDSYRVPDKPGLLMLTGNAGGLEITVDGSSIPDIGPKGAVRRDVLLDADSLKAAATR